MADQSQGAQVGAEPTTGAEPVAASGAPATGTGTGQEASSGSSGGDELKKQLEAAEKANKELKQQLHGLTQKLKETGSHSKSVEQQLADLAAKEEQRAKREQELQAQLDARTKADKVSKALESAVSAIPESRRKAALAIAKGLDVQGLDADDPAAAVKLVQEQLKKEHGFLFESGGRAPVIPGANNGSGGIPTVGMFNSNGTRIV